MQQTTQSCAGCGAGVVVQAGVAGTRVTCTACGRIFTTRKGGDTLARPKVASPSSVVVRAGPHDQSLRIRELRWKTLGKDLVMTAFVSWPFVLVVAFANAAFGRAGLVVSGALFALVWLQILAARFVVQTRIDVDRGGDLTVRTGLWGLRPLRVPASDVTQVYCTAHTWLVVTRRNKRGVERGERISGYLVKAKTKDGREQVLVGGVEDLQTGLFVEQELEAVLGLVDAGITGEAERRR